MKRFLGLLLTLSMIFLISVPSVRAQETKLKYPLIFIDVFYTAGSEVIEELYNRYNIKYDWVRPSDNMDQLVLPLNSGTGFPGFNTRRFFHCDFKSGVQDGTPYNTIVFFIGIPSVYVLHLDDAITNRQIDEINDIVKWAKENDVKIVGIHMDGNLARGNNVGGRGIPDNEKFIDAIAPACDILIVNSFPESSDGNFDGKFTKIAEEHDIYLRFY